MKRRIVVATVLVGCGLFAVTRVVAAAPQDLTRAPDGELRLCGEGKCIARAIGDFNGDGIDDLVFQTARSDVDAVLAGEMSFDVALSPWLPDTESPDPARLRRPAERGTLTVAGAQSLDPVRATDVDDDGIDDLVFLVPPGTTNVRGGQIKGAVHVVRGQTGWRPGSRRVDTAPGYHFLFGPTDAQFDIGLITADFADMDDDGDKDLVMGVDSGTRFGHRTGDSRVDIQFNPGRWVPTQQLSSRHHIVGIGNCVESLVVATDVTGDGRADIVTRRCAPGMPDQLRVVTGRASWPTWLSVESGGVNVPRPNPAPVPTGRERPPEGGYLPAPDPGVGSPAPALALAEDVNGDGLADPSIEFAGKLHVWFGGADIAARLSSGRSSAVIVNAGVGAARLTHAWGMTDINVDGVPDLLLSEPVDGSVNCIRLLCSGAQAPETGGSAVLLYTENGLAGRVVDPTLAAPSAEWLEPGRMLWGLGDFNGDGRDDLFLGSSPGAFDSIYAWAYGPLAPATTRAGVLNPGF